jgi:hypothetical protein
MSRDDTAFYRELTTRNAGVVDAAAQPLARLGVRRFLLADPGAYELNNLNRQNATLADLDRNKAEVAAERIAAINPDTEVRVFPQGVTAAVAAELAAACDVVVDGVDVTTTSGLRAKVVLHEQAAARRRPLFTGWDMAGAQYVRTYDYRRITRPFDGRLTAADVDRLDMWKLLQRLVPARYVPLEMIAIAAANLENPDFSFPQLVYAADLFGALSAHLVVALLSGQPVREHIYIDLHQAARPPLQRRRAQVRRPLAAAALLARLRTA